MADTNDSDTTYQLTIVGIYKNATDSIQQMGGPMRSTGSDPANAIYTSVSTLKITGARCQLGFRFCRAAQLHLRMLQQIGL